jgi:ribose 5-phosphate isomerase B
MTIYFAADHAGFRLKEALKKYAEELGCRAIDAGAFNLDSKDDYPDFVFPAVRAALRSGGRAVVIGGSGIGECIAANKVKGARAATCYDAYTAKMSRKDNDANVLCLGGRTVTKNPILARKIFRLWLTTKFSGASRHKRRLLKISREENFPA